MKKLRKNLATVVVITALFILPLRAAEDQKDTVDETPSVVIAVAPTYPPIALASGIGGEVKVDITIKADGRVSSAKITSGHRLLREGCEEAAKEWKFAEVTESRAVRRAQITFAFFAAAPRTPGKRLTTVFKLPLRIEITRRMNM
jgi:TonB family protein